ncbi:hypothetical protein [Thalassospira sp. ER-Se-21-Dark]|uniref:hypothetical protein n=1 Tax=Thalassospira sp. ER-Se-21-Dark TaxID=2585190 RepID=UPI001B30D68F|nr:hypothetical protein [Thalassospira sp. ER-Se-21-Dark]MBP3126375.1 hypothetical protein [Thalassospira sp. ER-Se-21-Dark]
MPFTTSWVKAITTGFVLVGASLALTTPVQSHPANQEHDHTVVELAQGGGIFSDEERRIIRDVLDIATGQTDQDSDKKNKGKGNKGLPPGIAMKLERGGTLPPGIAKRDLPDNLISRLPARTDGALRQIVGDDVVLIEKGTEIILDVIRDVARN